MKNGICTNCKKAYAVLRVRIETKPGRYDIQTPYNIVPQYCPQCGEYIGEGPEPYRLLNSLKRAAISAARLNTNDNHENAKNPAICGE